MDSSNNAGYSIPGLTYPFEDNGANSNSGPPSLLSSSPGTSASVVPAPSHSRPSMVRLLDMSTANGYQLSSSPGGHSPADLALPKHLSGNEAKLSSASASASSPMKLDNVPNPAVSMNLQSAMSHSFNPMSMFSHPSGLGSDFGATQPSLAQWLQNQNTNTSNAASTQSAAGVDDPSRSSPPKEEPMSPREGSTNSGGSDYAAL